MIADIIYLISKYSRFRGKIKLKKCSKLLDKIIKIYVFPCFVNGVTLETLGPRASKFQVIHLYPDTKVIEIIGFTSEAWEMFRLLDIKNFVIFHYESEDKSIASLAISNPFNNDKTIEINGKILQKVKEYKMILSPSLKILDKKI